MTCAYAGCPKPNHSHGLCTGHAAQRNRGTALHPIGQRRIGRRPPRPCAFPGCTNDDRSISAYCGGHRSQLQRGAPLTPLEYKHKWTEGNMATISEWRAGGWTWAQIGEHFGVSVEAARHARHRMIGPRQRRQPNAIAAPRERERPAVAPVFLLDRERRAKDKWERCRCGLLKPCNDCLPTSAAVYAEARRDAA